MPIVIKSVDDCELEANLNKSIGIFNTNDIQMPDGNYPRDTNVLFTSLYCNVNSDGNIVDIKSKPFSEISKYKYYYVSHNYGKPLTFIAMPFENDELIYLQKCSHVNGHELELLTTTDEYYKNINESIILTRGEAIDDGTDLNHRLNAYIKKSIEIYDLNGYNFVNTHMCFTSDTCFSYNLIVINKI